MGVTQADPPRARARIRPAFQGSLADPLSGPTTQVSASHNLCKRTVGRWKFPEDPLPLPRRHAPCGASGFALHHQRHGAALPHSHQHTRRERNHAVDTPRSSRRHRCRGLLSLGGNYLGALAPSHYCLARAIYISNGIVSSKMRKPAMESR